MDIDLKAVRLDKNQHFATVYPPENGAHFHQNGFYFDHQGFLAEKFIDEKTRGRIDRAQNRAKADRAAREAKEAFMKENALTEEDLAIDPVGTMLAVTRPEISAGDVDLVAWARGEKKYRFFVVRKAALEQYKFEAMTQQPLLDFMVDEGKIDAADIKI